MKPISFFNDNSGSEDDEIDTQPVREYKLEEQDDVQTQPDITIDEHEDVTLGTKIKVVAAMAVVGLAVGVAYWVQTPTDLKTDVLATDESAPLTDNLTLDEPDAVAAVEETPATQVPETETPATQVPSASVQEVSIIDFNFEPDSLTVTPGTTVVWTNMDAVAHTVSSDQFTSEALNSGDSFMYTFNQEGTFDYFCSIHPQMTGSIVVSVDMDTSAPVPTLYSAAEDTGAYEFPDFDALAFDTLATSPTSEEILALGLMDESALHAVSPETSTELAKSGPEDILYFGLFLAILYFTGRRRFLADA
ncbi:cupredoxin family copper-binding protein [Patescibacteria group bacterium]|nr:cupredoxin family copper-binding protein [Patescibacteria group bacterium]MBU1953406.1 cupredoxin family copper-binding protein [Patescibacteria group bacterium]